MMMLLIIILFLVGFVLTLSGIRESWPLGGEVTSPAEMIKLRALNDRINKDMERTLALGRSCFKTFSILARSKYRSFPDPFIAVMRDNDWKRLRSMVRASARRGYRHCQDLLNISMEEPDVILLREAFAFCLECCRGCQLLSAEEGKMPTCPIVKAYSSRSKENA